MPSSLTYSKRDQVDLIEIDNDFATASVALFGAHILSFKPKSDNRERLWLSEQAIFDGHSAIRGGIPVCWPWFSDRYPVNRPDLPSHGFVRTQNWQLISSKDTETGTELTLRPESTRGPGFEHAAELTLHIQVGQTLSVCLSTFNVGEQPFSITSALHTYFLVRDIEKVHLSGLSGKFEDKTQNFATFPTPSPYTFKEETDRVHLVKARRVDLHEDGQLLCEVGSAGHDSIVVWNPWQENAIKLKDMPDTGYRHMLCVETAVTQGVQVQPEQQHQLIQTIR